jgi:hypothetical protein
VTGAKVLYDSGDVRSVVQVAIIHAKTQIRAFPFKIRKISNCAWILMIKKQKFKLKMQKTALNLAAYYLSYSSSNVFMSF